MRVAERAGFRFTDVLVWDTGGALLNACVTGIVPGFRYVLLTDSLVDTMTPTEVAAVFGHEIGHIAHRHLLFFGLFFAGSLGILALLGRRRRPGLAMDSVGTVAGELDAIRRGQVAQEAAVLILLGLYFWLVFGHLSRRFERQADVFGSKVVSCERAECPPHVDPDGDPSAAKSKGKALPTVPDRDCAPSPRPWPSSPSATGWSSHADRGGTAASPAGSDSWSASSGSRRSSGGCSVRSSVLRLVLGVVLVLALVAVAIR